MNEQIGTYRIQGEIGRGGMGVVYRAVDERLGRTVAIKALPEELSADAGRLERFEREARTLAALNHPNLAGIHGLEEFDGHKYLVLEFVDGETLADRLDRGPLDVDDAIGLAVQIAAGIEAAHEAGVIHRDLKPANIKITPEGVAKVLDFGLAKADEGSVSGSSLSQSPTLTTPAKPATVEGAILGTAAYMSPEQARGRKVDKRSDVWSFGVVLYEMLCGASPFIGETATDSIGAVLHKDLDLDRLPEQTPAGVKRVLSRCVERDKSLRYRDIGDVRVELLRAMDEPAEVAAAGGGVGWLVAALVGVVCLAVGGVVAWVARPVATPVVTKVDLFVTSEEEELEEGEPQISPDGRRVAYLANDMIQVRELDSFEPRELSGTEGAKSVFWSPDGAWIGYTQRQSVYKVRVAGGGAIKVCDLENQFMDFATGAWTQDGRIVVHNVESLYEVSDRGGEPSVFLAPGEDEIDFHQVRSVRGSSAVVFVTHLNTLTGQRVEVSDGTRRVVVAETNDETFMSVSYSPTGHVLYSLGFRSPKLWAVGFDPEAMEVTGEPFQIMDGATAASASDDGTLLVKRGSVVPPGGAPVWVDAESGEVRPLEVGSDLEIQGMGKVSPDGRLVAVSVGLPTKMDVWLLDLERKSTSRLTFSETFSMVVGWSPDSREVALITFDPSAELGALKTEFLAADGSGPTREPLTGFALGFDRAWERVLVHNDPREGRTEIRLRRLGGTDEGEVVYETDSVSAGPGGNELSPDGDLMLITDSSSGTGLQVFCLRVDGGRGRYQVSTDEGSVPTWSPDGKWVYFQNRSEGLLMRSSVEREIAEDGTLTTVRFGIPELVLDFEEHGLDLQFGWWFGQEEGKYLAMMSDKTGEEERTSLSIVTNWFEEFDEN